MGTGAHKYMAKWFFSDAKIQSILQESSKSEATTKQSKNDVIKINTDSDITRMQVDGDGKFTANVLIIKDPNRVKIGYAAQIGYVGETTREMAKRYKAVAAINGGYFKDTSPNKQSGGVGAIPTGFIMSNGQIVYPQDNSNWSEITSEEENRALTIDKDGNLQVGGTYSPDQLIKSGIREAVITEPYLIKNGKNTIQANSVSGTNPRTAIGQRADKSIIFMVIDGRQGVKLGATVGDVQVLMHKLGAVNAACLDGGGSTAMYYNGEIINNPSNATGERAVPDIIYVEPK